MLDFLIVSTRTNRRGTMEIYPRFKIKNSDDLMIRGGDFYAIWVNERGLWSTDEQDAIELIDHELDIYYEKAKQNFDGSIRVMHLWDSETGMIDSWHKYCQKQMWDHFHTLDEKLIFSNMTLKKTDYASKHLNYPLTEGSYPAYDKIMSTLYTDSERHKIEWVIGAIVTGDSQHIQKFLVLYGAMGTGKSTVIHIIEQLFDGYWSVFDAKALGSSNSTFALESFRNNPLVAIQHDGDLSRIEDNTRLNSLVSHETMTVNEKFKSTYSTRFRSFLIMATNKPVKITDAKSGLIRRLIDVQPSGNKLPKKEYDILFKQVSFELGAIAYHCKEVYLKDPSYYDNYIPTNMMGASNDFYNFVEDSHFIFEKDDGITAKAAWKMYKEYCDEAKVSYPYSYTRFKEELKNYFNEYFERHMMEDGTRARCWYQGFKEDAFITQLPEEQTDISSWIDFKEQPSLLDEMCADYKAQYASSQGTPIKKWDNVKTVLKDLDTSKLHYVMLPPEHIVIDFDITDDDGNKSFERNLEEASKWPPTYAELSKSGAGIHLHYIYSGDPDELNRVYGDQIEVKVFVGNSSLRRKLTKCTDILVAVIDSGLPLKEKKGDRVVNFETANREKSLRTLITKNLNREYHANTKPSIDFIYHCLEDAYKSGDPYDVEDMRTAILAFAADSTNNAEKCVELVSKMHFKSDEPSEQVDSDDHRLVFYDVEVFPNLFLVCWKFAGEESPVIRLFNPSPNDIAKLMYYRLVGFNCRRYDNHMIYACLLGRSNEELYNLSQNIINNGRGFFAEAWNVSYTDIYDFCSKKQSLKKWEIELGIHHQELGLPWDQPVDESMWEKVADYCDNDVLATEALFNNRQGDFIAREILAALAGMSVNDTTNSLTTRIIFGKEKHPKLIYTDLATGEQY